ncbi:Holliday junction resolvase RecU [Haploplasma modicum]|jgi:recombination protein U|uniref:Holliday junction resolvase RecU n=1 Tax=Haploplasma modicum TaxID=2150 RepID=UPI00214B6FC6|nr:Holliday junction resolvase RecU [Haploplasma modicum]MCR1808854.1 Holliday junction resolvase RecU [Haploplasma modicum]
MKYPNKKTLVKQETNYANLGMTLESDLEYTNNYYLVNDIAVIHKKPTPVQIVNVSYPSRNKAKITEAYYKTPSTTDFNGIYKGKYIDFDAKETNNKTAYPLSNIHEHQVTHLRNVEKHGGIAFLIVHFKKHNKYFFLPFSILAKYWDKKNTERKSIPYTEFLQSAYEINIKYNPRLDYLKIIDEYYLSLVSK